MTKPFDKMLDAIKAYADAYAQLEVHNLNINDHGVAEHRDIKAALFNQRERFRREMLDQLYLNFDTSHKDQGMFSDRADVLLAYFDHIIEPSTLGKELIDRMRGIEPAPVDAELPKQNEQPFEEPQRGQKWYASWKFDSDSYGCFALVELAHVSDQIVDFVDQDGDRQVFPRSLLKFIERVQ